MGTALTQEMMLMKKLELVQLRKKIEDLATFLPDEILRLRPDDMDIKHTFVGVLLYVYISGFTELTEKYNKFGKGGIYGLTATLDAYIGAIVEVLAYYGGDVLKFTGNSFLTLWKVKPEDSLYETLHEVVVCALVIQQALGHFETECVNVYLQTKMAITCGNLTFTVISADIYMDYVIVGEAVNDVQDVYQNCLSGEVVVSYCAWAHMLQERYDITPGNHGHIKVWKILYMPNEEDKQLYYDQRQTEAQKLCTLHINHRQTLRAKPTFDSTVTASKITEGFVRTLQKRPAIKIAPKYWHIDGLRPFIIDTVQHQIDESQPVEYLTELRVVTVQLVNVIPISVEVDLLIETVRNVYGIISNIARSVLGMVNYISLFHKDICVFISHGLGGIKHEMLSQNALKTAYKIRQALITLPNVSIVSVSVTHGFVYCGAVGHPMRRTFTLIGDSVNKANTMLYTFPAKVTCDHITFKHSKLSSFYFQLINTELHEAFKDFQVFEYNEGCENDRPPGDETLRIIGRKAEWNYLRMLLIRPDKMGYGICMHGGEKIGKSILIRCLLREFKTFKQYHLASVDLTLSCTIPYFTISRLYRQLYDHKATVHAPAMDIIKNLPRDLYDPAEMANNKIDDVAAIKYKILKTFRDMIRFNSKPTILFIDNLQYIDLQSWEIIEIVMKDHKVRLMSAAILTKTSAWDLKWKISLSEEVALFELGPVDQKYIAALACQFLNAAGISTTLLRFLKLSCEGKPGYVQSCLLSLANNECIEMTLINNVDDSVNVVFPEPKLLGYKNETKIPRIIGLSEKYLKKREQITLDAISMDLFDSFTPYQQLVIKTGAVLGDIFTRNLLKVVLKFPSEVTLAHIIGKLFNEEVFDCGSRYMYAHEIETNKLCCRCYHDETLNATFNLPNYAFCKIIHFKNRTIRKIAYNLIPDNHRKDLHLRCGDILEEMHQQCPYCLREPSFNSIAFRKFKQTIWYCKNPQGTYGVSRHTDEPAISPKPIIRSILHHGEPTNSATKIKSICKVVWDPQKCQCYEIMSTIYKDLIYHSARAQHLYKHVYFTMYYGILLNLMGDFEKAKIQLLLAREMLLVDSNKFQGRVDQNFRKLHIARIDMSLASSYIRLRQFNAAKSYLACALRQFSIPMMAWSNKLCNKFLTRSKVVKKRRAGKSKHTTSILKHDMGMCLILCSKLFVMQGNWLLAKYTINHALFILRNVCLELPILFDGYCNAVDIYRHFDNHATCVKLHRCVLLEIQSKIASHRSLSLFHICTLLVSIFQTRCVSGNILGGIRLGYRLIDINYRVYAKQEQIQIFNWMVTLLMYNFRLKDYVDLCKIMHQNVYLLENNEINVLRYYMICMSFYLHSGFIIEQVANIILFADTFFSYGMNNLNSMEQQFCFYLHIHYLRLGKFDHAAEWFVDIRRDDLRDSLDDYGMKMLLFGIEANLLKYLRAKTTDKVEADNYMRVAEELIQLADRHTKNTFIIFRPMFLLYKAWFFKLKKRHFQTNWSIKEAEKISLKQQNHFTLCLGKQLTNYWSGGFSYEYGSKPAPDFEEAKYFTLQQWAQIMHHFPIE